MARAIVGALAAVIVAGRIVGSASTPAGAGLVIGAALDADIVRTTTAAAVAGLVVGTALAGGGGVIGTTTLADVTGRIIAATALADMTSGIVGTTALAGLGSGNGKRGGKGGADQRKAGNLRHDLSPITIVGPNGRTEGKRHQFELIPGRLKKSCKGVAGCGINPVNRRLISSNGEASCRCLVE